MSKTFTFTILKNVCRCHALHLLKTGPISFTLDHSPCARMIVTLEKSSILWRCQSPYHHRWQTCPLRVSPFLLPTFYQIPLWWRPLVVNVSFWIVRWASAHHWSLRSWLLLIPRAQRYFLTLRFSFPQDFRCSRGKHVRIPHVVSRDQIHHRLWFCSDLSSPPSSCVLFDIASRQLMELKWLLLNKKQKMIPLITCEIFLC